MMAYLRWIAISSRYAKKKLTLAAFWFIHFDPVIIADLLDPDNFNDVLTIKGKIILSSPKKTAFPISPDVPNLITLFCCHVVCMLWVIGPLLIRQGETIIIIARVAADGLVRPKIEAVKGGQRSEVGVKGQRSKVKGR